MIETERLLLRPIGLDDVADCTALWGDPATMGFIGNGQPLSAEEVWSRTLRHIGHWHALGYGYWAVRETANGGFVGDVGFQTLRRAIEPSLGDRPEIGWVLAAAAQGRGFAREAVAGVLDWADAHLSADETCCIIRPAHARSIRIAEAVGYQRTGTARYGAASMEVFARPRGFQSRLLIPTS
ncbi:GNAT family N-acetyltransferase [Lichenihabitans sp. Uapishka_5]|uniref:GNAT family N-acetyltransferase n=1 Tax=Lichenihabitans sp. Uapishka_5 TaxID=3037302 RepID=UPI0029E8254C|nr:GNAT family N-acetyltransferase [Lichenihabitans sp. Uapishka_5]MDX7953003.1 GNAT family N-acetyltransferase [Lichenihabitans sp. Uapishka_5]